MTMNKWGLSEEEQKHYIKALADKLPPLRAKTGISQGELANLIGISRQTYSAIECRRKEMSWSTYLSLILFFDYQVSTHEMLRSLEAFPARLISRMNDGCSPESGLLNPGSGELTEILQELDDQALHAVKTMLLVEYARCKQIPGDVVIKAFDGMDLAASSPDAAAETALKRTRKRPQ